MINEGQPPSFRQPDGVSFSGDCAQIDNTNNANGMITTGEHQTCTITNTQEGAAPPPG
jgi:hypothetical protein